MIPETFKEWKLCISVQCNIHLNADFARERLAVLQNNEHLETQKFKALYGQKHLDNIINWFKQV